MSLAIPRRRVAVAGNPNTGKTTLFNRLTGSRARVGNYPGITVDRHFGLLRLPRAGEIELMDVPGTYSLAARSAEEELAIQAIAGLHPLEKPDAIVVVVDATQLARNLYFVLQVLELGIPTVIALNMVDELGKSGQEVDVAALEREIGVPVRPVVALRGEGLDALRASIDAVLANGTAGRPGWCWRPTAPALVADLTALEDAVPESWHHGDQARRRALALWSLLSIDEHDELRGVPAGLRVAVRARRAAAEATGRSIEEEVIQGRYAWIDARVRSFLHETRSRIVSLTDRLDRVLLHPALGFAIFLVAMGLVFQALFTGADPFIGWIERAIAALGRAVEGVLPAGSFRDLLVHGLIEGVGAVLVFLPQILLLFFFLGVMEDTGYMSRVAVLMDRIMKMIGLHGRAFVPMLSGYACAVPAIMATRTMERKRDRLLTMMVVPLMTCSARLPVYGLLIAALYPPHAQAPFAQGLLLVAIYLFTTVLALLCAAVLGRTVLRGPRIPLIVEMPPYRMPHWPSVLRMMGQKSMCFVRQAGTIILVCSVGMWVLLSFPRHSALATEYEARRAEVRAELAAGESSDLTARLAALDGEEESARLRGSYAGRFGRLLEPVLAPLGFDWQIGIGLIGAFAAREVFVSTMAVVYGLGPDVDEQSDALRDRIRLQRRPDGQRVFTPLVCFSLMVFFALACQCMSTLATVKRETATWRWPALLFAYMTALAWGASFLVYQGGRLLGFE
ncbi:MAG: ferrous iron transport protein B [Planctomycetota bacterium]